MASANYHPPQRFAYLILAHSEPQLLKILIDCLDDARNDIYIHIDGKVDITPFLKLTTKHSQLFFIQKKRVKVFWGCPSQIEAELELFKMAVGLNKHYSYYHLISGQDLPIKTQNEIHDFFSKNNGYEFINVSDYNTKEIIKKCRLYHILLKYVRHNNSFIKNISNIIRRGVCGIQYILGYRRGYSYDILAKGANWCSLTESFVRYIVENEATIRHEFKMTHCTDEIYKQTLAMNSTEFKDKIYPNGNLRLVDFKRGNGQSPYVYRQEDLNTILKSNMMFARKFSLNIDSQIISSIKQFTCEQP